MTVTINGTTGASAIQDATVTSVKIVDGTVATADLATAATPLGVGQTWQTVTRASGTPYTNSTGRPIQLNVLCVAGSGTTALVVGGVSVGTTNGTTAVILTACIPDGTVYTVTDTGTNTHTSVELR